MLRIRKSAHLISLIDMTQDKYVEKDMVTLW